jgi:RNA polymerase sigma-70 factor (ECF subfamily)
MTEKDFENLFRNQFTPLSNLAFTVVKNADVAKDIVQQVFIKLWDKKQSLNITGPMEPYLYRMVINTSLNHIKKEKKYTRLEDNPSQINEQDTDAQENTDNIETKEKKVRDAIGELPPQCQTVFSLSRYQNLSNKEIASHLGISVKTVEKHITVAFKALRVKLKPILNSELDILIILLVLKFLISQVGNFIFYLS